MFAHSIKGCRPLGRTCGVLIPSPCEIGLHHLLFLKFVDPHLGFLTFSSNKHWWQLRAFSFRGKHTREPRVALLPKGRLRHWVWVKIHGHWCVTICIKNSQTGQKSISTYLVA